MTAMQPRLDTAAYPTHLMGLITLRPVVTFASVET